MTTGRRQSHSSFDSYQACPRRYEWRYVERLRKVRKADALTLGAVIHGGLDLLKQGKSILSVIAWIHGQFEQVPAWVSDLDKWHVDREIAVALVAGWYWHWQSDPLIYHSTEERLEIALVNPETSCKSTAHGFVLTLDGRVERPSNPGRILLLEHKTTSRSIDPDSDYIRALRLDPQLNRYAAATGIQHILYDVIKKPGIRPKAITKAAAKGIQEEGLYHGEVADKTRIPKRETPELFRNRLVEDIARRPGSYFARFNISRLRSDIAESKRDDWGVHQQILASKRTSNFPRNTRSCLAPYKCDYCDLCFAGESPSSLGGEVPDGFYKSERRQHA